MSTPRSSTPGSGLPRRRNGKEQACEPCRKAKIACDHTLPVCTRCKRRKITDKCVYMSAPMTRVADPSLNLNRRQSEPIQPQLNNGNPHITHQSSIFPLTPTTGSSAVVSPESATAPHGFTAPPTNSALFSLARTSSANSFIPQTRTARDKEASLTLASLGSKTNGFFGPTSFSAVFAENRENLGGNINDDIPITNERVPYIHSDESLSAQMYMLLAGKTELEVGEPRLTLGARVLAALPDKNTCSFLLEYYFEKCHDAGSLKRITMEVCSSFWNTFEQDMKEPRCMDDLEKVSSVMCKNVTTPLEESEDWETYIASFTGQNMRWEAIGTIFAGLSSSLLSLPERDGFFKTQRGSRADRKHFAVEMKDCLQACISLSNYMDFLNIIMVAILCRNMFVQTVLSGDTSLICWRQLGDLVSATTALGLHRQNFPRVTFLTELKKHIFGVVFGIDKSASLLTGRPPALSFRYTRFEPPLDLDDDVVIRGGEELRRAIEKLDANGWNTDNVVYGPSLNRGRILLSIDLNEVLELSLGNPADATPERIEYLIARLETTHSSFPDVMKLNLHGPDSGPDWAFLCRLCLRLDVLEYRLILERLAHKNGVRNGQTMIDCAREMLEHVVLLWVQRDRFVEKHCDYDWMLMCWGVPSSGVLCVELLKQIRQPAGTEHVLKLPRSEIVQNLSLLIGFLEWVRPAAGNYLLCRRMSLLIKRLLDQILNPSPPANNNANQTTNNHLPAPSQDSMHDGHSNFDTASSNGMVGFGAGPFDPQFDQDGTWEEGLGDLDWLNAVDWSRGPWRLDLGGQDVPASRWN